MPFVSFIKSLIDGTNFWRALQAKRRACAIRKHWSKWDDRSAQFYRRFIRSGDLCFDVGANVGNRTHIFHRLGARVVSVEPQKACVAGLRAAYAGDSTVTVANVALGAMEGKTELRVGSCDAIGSLSEEWIAQVKSIARFSDDWGRSESCRVTTLDELIRKYGLPAFIKIDVEGYELEVIKGLGQPVPCLSIEFTPECCGVAEQCLRRLDILGFKSFALSEGESLSLTEWADIETFSGLLVKVRDQWVKDKQFGDIYARTSLNIQHSQLNHVACHNRSANDRCGRGR